jgi:hypothetical protein
MPQLVILFAVPVVIIAVSITSAYIIKRSVKSVLHSLKEELENVSALNEAVFARELLRFFAESDASQAAMDLIAQAKDTGMIDSGVAEMTFVAKNDVEKLYKAMQSSLEPRVEYSKLGYISSFFPRVIVIYGAVLSVATFIIYTLELGFLDTEFFDVSYGIIIGATSIFSVLIAFLVGDFIRHADRISIAKSWGDLRSQ